MATEIKNLDRFVVQDVDNFWQIRFLDKYMQGHKGFIAGGCFKNILERQYVKDIDIFFESEEDFQDAVDYYNGLVESGDTKWKFKYRNENACAFQEEGSKVWIELICSIFGPPQFILNNFDFTVTKMAYFKQEVETEVIDDKGNTVIFEDGKHVVATVYHYKLMHHSLFFEHLHQKRLVIDNEIPFPISTFERTYRYCKYGYGLCRESKSKLLEAIRNTTKDDEKLGMYLQNGWD